MVVVPQPAVKGGRALRARGVDGAVGPAGEERADEAFRLSVCLWPERARAQVADAEPATVEGGMASVSAISAAVIRSQRRARMAATRSAGVRLATRRGAEERSRRPSLPSLR